MYTIVHMFVCVLLHRIRQLGQADLKVYGCHQIMNCTVVRGLPPFRTMTGRVCTYPFFHLSPNAQVCPKKLNPGLSISRLKLLTHKLADLDKKLMDKEAIEQAIRKFMAAQPPVTEA